jgi:polysaccharide export outer membrane protein
MARNGLTAFALMVALGFAGCATVARAQPFPPIPMSTAPNGPPAAFTAQSAPYRFYPGDEVEITVLSAPELTRRVTIAPDGRIDLPLIDPLLAADRTAEELRDALLAAYARDLRTPELEVTATGYGSNQVYVAGEVSRAGVYEFRGPIDPLQAIALAGGFLNTARRQEVVIISRVPGGPREVTIVDLRNPEIQAGLMRAPTLRRFDVVFVPRSRVANWNLWVQQYVRDALPINFSLFYDLAGNR